MMLISRVTSPAQMLSNSYSRIGQYKQAKLQINQTMAQRLRVNFPISTISFLKKHLR